MKKFYTYLLTAFAVVMVFAACNTPNEPTGDEPDPFLVDYSELIVGTWAIDSSLVYYPNISGRLPHFFPGLNKLMTFNADGSFSNSDSVQGTYVLDTYYLTIITEGEEKYQITTCNDTAMVYFQLGYDTFEDQPTQEVFYLHRVTK